MTVKLRIPVQSRSIEALGVVARPGVRGRWLVVAALAIWLGLVFGSYFAVSARQIWPKIVSVLGG